MNLPLSTTRTTGLVIVTDMIANTTKGLKKFGLVATMATRFLGDLDLN